MKKKKSEEFIKEISNFIGYCAERWQDEKEYEDINDYKTEIQKRGQSFGVTVTKMISRPFGFEFTVDDEPERFVCKTKLRGKSISLELIAYPRA